MKDKQANYRATTPSALRGEAIDGPHRPAVRPEAMTRVFAGRHNQVACARAFVRTALGPVSVVDEAVLLASELCTNALLHTASGYDGTFEVAVYLGSLSVRIEVRDGGAAQAPSVRQPVGTFAEYGRGLDLVELLSDRWGYSGDSNGRSVVAEGNAPAGERWYLKAGGSADDYYTLLETVHPDGCRDEGGMGGPVLYSGHLLNVYTGRADPGLLRVIVRADPRVRRLRLQSELGEWCDILAVAEDAELGVTFFAILLPWTTGLVSLQAVDADGKVLPP